jgi:transposase InsO family protein
MRAALTAKSEGAVSEQSSGQLLYVRTSASLLVDQNGDPVTLRGVTVQGLDTVAPASDQTFPAALTLDGDSLLEMSDRWGVNLVRLPFQAQTVLSGNGSVTAAAMLAGLDATVAAITEAGAYVLFALEASPGGPPPAPDASTVQAWQALALRYRAEPRVLYELFASASPLDANWLQSAATLVAAVRQQNPDSVIFLGSGHGGVDVTGLPLISQTGDPVWNVVYTIAVSTQRLPDPDDGQFRALAESYPVFVSMWSDDGADFGRLSAHAADLFERYGIGWAASSWNADPRLVVDAVNHDFTPTGWGLIAQRALARSAVTAFKPSGAVAESVFTAHGPELVHLKTIGNFIVDENDDPVTLRGVTIRGLDAVAPASDQTFPAALALDDSNLQEMTVRWGVNLVRLPFQAQTILSGNGSVSVAAMLAGLDATVASIANAGAYVLLALEAPRGHGTPDAPDIRAIQVWQVLAERYKENPAVLCEIFSSPSLLSANWPQVAAILVATIRQRKPASLIFLGSGNGEGDAGGLPLLSPTGDPVFNLVYTIAVSPGFAPNPDDGRLRVLSESSPVFASVWSDGGSDFGRSSARVPDLFDRYGIGWAASSWNAEPRLIADAAGHDFTSTGWGLIVGRAFRLPRRVLLKPFGSDARR